MSFQDDAGDKSLNGIINYLPLFKRSELELIIHFETSGTAEDVLRAIERIKAFKQILGNVDGASLEKTIDNFKRDAHPESELVIWERIASTFQTFLAHNPTTDPAVRKEILAVLIGASMGAEDHSNIKHLSDDQIKHLIANYR